MAAKKFIRLIAGVLTEAFGVQASAGAGNAGDIVALDDTGKIDPSMMPTGVGADVVMLTATEALAAGDWINIYSAGMRKADASTAGKPCDGFVLAAVSSGAVGAAYKEGTNTQVTGQTMGADVFLSATPGAGTHTPLSTAGNASQRIGKAVSTTAVDFERGQPITLA